MPEWLAAASAEKATAAAPYSWIRQPASRIPVILSRTSVQQRRAEQNELPARSETWNANIDGKLLTFAVTCVVLVLPPLWDLAAMSSPGSFIVRASAAGKCEMHPNTKWWAYLKHLLLLHASVPASSCCGHNCKSFPALSRPQRSHAFAFSQPAFEHGKKCGLMSIK